MNLGDGLKLETQTLDGKTRLVIAFHDEPLNKTAKGTSQLKKRRSPFRSRLVREAHNGSVRLGAASDGSSSRGPKPTPFGNSQAAQSRADIDQRTSNPTEKLSDPQADHGPVQYNHTQKARFNQNISTNGPQIKFLQSNQQSKEQRAIGNGQTIVLENGQNLQQNGLQMGKNNRSRVDKNTAQQEVKQRRGLANGKPVKAADARGHVDNAQTGSFGNGLVCLTQEQLQQILASIGQSVNSSNTDGSAPLETELDKEKDIVQYDNETKPEDASSSAAPFEKTQGISGSVFGMLGEREKDREILQAKKAQWKKELDQQLALKNSGKKQELEVWEEWNPFGKPGAGAPVLSATGQPLTTFNQKFSIFYKDHSKLQATLNLPAHQPESGYLTVPATSAQGTASGARNTAQDYVAMGQTQSFASSDLPAAIRSSFVIGEAAPRDKPFSASNREKQQRWREELEQQREAQRMRRQQEKIWLKGEADQGKWEAHFDSFSQKPNVAQAETHGAVTSVRLDAGRTFHPQDPLHSPHVPLTDASKLPSPINSHLRTMTALLDPAQLDERERQRLKQLEHQKAIASQMEERRRHKLLEDERRRYEEEEAERKITEERHRLNRQFLEEQAKLRQKEENRTRKTENLYQSVQRAQEEALRDKQEQRMRELARKGHDVSNLRRSREGMPTRDGPVYVAVEEETVRQRDGHSRSTLRVHEPESSMKDTGVQTDADTGRPARGGDGTGRVFADSTRPPATPHVPAEYSNTGVTCRSRIDRERPGGNGADKQSGHDEEASSKTPGQSDTAKRKSPRDNAETKPAWNMTTKPVVGCVNPAGGGATRASDKYPKALKKRELEREARKQRRQEQLLAMVNRNVVSKGQAPASDAARQEDAREAAHKQKASRALPSLADKTELQAGDVQKKKPLTEHNNTTQRTQQGNVEFSNRLDSPAVPALRHRLQQQQQQKEEEAGAGGDHAERGAGHAPEAVHIASHRLAPLHDVGEAGGQRGRQAPASRAGQTSPPNAAFVPYLRSDDVLYLDPDAPMSRPPTNESQYRYGRGYLEQRRHSSEQSRDPLLNPELLKSKDRQKAILEGLSQLRQGLLMKQREVETYLSSPMLAEDVSQFPMQSKPS
ncbi:coiled-coil domain-containing protein 66 isoform X1 [Petromyzon marinus]|uniref:Coiled-coil domain-containing protein 66 isoform X1 n=1 Tax=Petromyzon marinus TaxID=7757 RepID=A0AAJ7TWX5_PETMA|nr:coiled-coil domain-containing protein 66 isoform X1 [Petromyzon marinus]